MNTLHTPPPAGIHSLRTFAIVPLGFGLSLRIAAESYRDERHVVLRIGREQGPRFVPTMAHLRLPLAVVSDVADALDDAAVWVEEGSNAGDCSQESSR